MFTGFQPDTMPAGANLRRLLILRAVIIVVLTLALGGVSRWLEMPLPLLPVITVGVALTVFNGLSWWRLGRPRPVSDQELTAQLALDVAALTVILYFCGGATNPFVSLYLVPLALAAAALPRACTWVIALLAVAGYSLLMLTYIPLPHHHGQAGRDFDLHVMGMWTNFIFTVGIIGVFVVNMGAALRLRDRQLQDAREQALRHEQIVALGTLAAGAAHELGTPLSTMAVVTGELAHEHGGNAPLLADLSLLRTQIELCKTIITRMVAAAGGSRAEAVQILPVDDYLAQTVSSWQLMRPAVPVAYRGLGSTPAPTIVAEQTLTQALLNLLNNAADASPEFVEVEASWDQRQFVMRIRDKGPGITSEVASHLGEAFFTTKQEGKGSGLGLFLSNATLERFGGRVCLVNEADGGARTDVTVPLRDLLPKAA